MTLQQDIETMLAEHLAPAKAAKLAADVTKRVVQSVNADRAAVRDRLLAALDGKATAAAAPVKAKGKTPKAVAPKTEGARKVAGTGALRMPLLKRVHHAEKRKADGKPAQAADAYVLENVKTIQDGSTKDLKSITAEVKRLTITAEKAEKDAKKQRAANEKAAKIEAARAKKAAAAEKKAAAAAKKAEKKSKGKKKADEPAAAAAVAPAPNGATHASGPGMVSDEALL